MPPFWNDSPESWDRVILGGIVLAGLADVRVRVGRKIDIRSRPQADGARVRDRGYNPAQIEIRLRVFTAPQLVELQDQLPQLHPRGAAQPTSLEVQRAEAALARERAQVFPDPETLEELEANLERARSRPRPRSRRTPLDIVSTQTELLGIRTVYIREISILALTNQVLEVTIRAVEWTAEPPAAPPPAASSTGAGGDLAQQETAFDAREEARPDASPGGLEGAGAGVGRLGGLFGGGDG